MSLINTFLRTEEVNDTSSPDEHLSSPDTEQDALIAKAVTMVVLCFVSTIMGIVPIFLARSLKWDMSGQNPRSTRMVSVLLGFGGGVLLSTTFLHLVPEVAEGVENLVESNKLPQLNVSLAELLCCTGFFIMYLVEESVHTYLRKRQAEQQDTKKNVNLSTNDLVENGQVPPPCANNGHAHTGHSHLPAIMDDDLVITSLRGLLIVLGLSVHELFEGLAIGLESSSGQVWYMFLAVASHKFVIAFCIGMELLASRTKPYLSVIYTCTFAVVSPIGIGIGMGLVGGGSAAASGPMAVILQGLASGTLLYVVFFEILQEHRTGLRQYLSILVGFLVMFGLQMLTSRHRLQGLLTSLLLCFGGGVLLFTTFVHLAPEVRASVENHQSNGQLPDLETLGLAELLFCSGFFLVYLVEEAVHAVLTGKPESSEALLYRTVSVRRCNNNQTGPSGSSMMSNGSITTVSTTTKSAVWNDANDVEDDRDRANANRSKLQLDDPREAGKDDKVLPTVFVLPVPLASEGAQVIRRHSELQLAMPELNYPVGHHHSHEHHQHAAMMQNTSVQGLLTVLALSFHAIFEGLAVGLEPSISSVAYLAAAIATHKLVISFCVGMELYVAGASTKTILGYLSIFSMVTPIGIAVGLVLDYFKNDSENLGPTPTILQGMAAGTLLYVVFFEVLARERANEKSGLLQLLAIIVGFTLMLGLQIATAHSHSHGGHGHSHGDHEVHQHGHSEEDHDHDHDHEHEHDHKHDVVAEAIDKVTDSIAEALSNALTSSTTVPSTNVSETSPLYPRDS